MHVEAKWYSRAVRPCQVGQFAETLTWPVIIMNFAKKARSTKFAGGRGSEPQRRDLWSA